MVKGEFIVVSGALQAATTRDRCSLMCGVQLQQRRCRQLGLHTHTHTLLLHVPALLPAGAATTAVRGKCNKCRTPKPGGLGWVHRARHAAGAFGRDVKQWIPVGVGLRATTRASDDGERCDFARWWLHVTSRNSNARSSTDSTVELGRTEEPGGRSTALAVRPPCHSRCFIEILQSL